jgi:Tol biopolymer transport system component
MRKKWLGVFLALLLIGSTMKASALTEFPIDWELEGVSNATDVVVNILQLTPTVDDTNASLIYVEDTDEWVPCWGPNPWSPNGKQIVFQTGSRSGTSDLVVMNADGTGWQTLTSDTNSTHGGFFDNGRKIVFQRKNGDSRAEIWTMNADGTGEVNLTLAHGGASETTEYDEAKPVVSPDGRKVLFHSNDEGLWVMNIDGSSPITISGEELIETSKFSWSPDSRWVLFNARTSYEDNTVSRIYKVRPDGSELTMLSEDVDEIFCENWATWSPDGRWIAYHRRENKYTDEEHHSLMMMRPDRTDKTVLRSGFSIDDEENCGPTSWHPGSKWLAFKQHLDDETPISIINIETKEIIKLTEGYGDGRMWWSPDGVKILFSDRYYGSMSDSRDGDEYNEDLLVINLDDSFRYTRSSGSSGCTYNPVADFGLDALLLLGLAGLLFVRRRLN